MNTPAEIRAHAEKLHQDRQDHIDRLCPQPERNAFGLTGLETLLVGSFIWDAVQRRQEPVQDIPETRVVSTRVIRPEAPTAPREPLSSQAKLLLVLLVIVTVIALFI